MFLVVLRERFHTEVSINAVNEWRFTSDMIFVYKVVVSIRRHSGTTLVKPK